MTSASLRPLLCLIFLLTIAFVPSANAYAGSPAIEFDMAPLAVAHPLAESHEMPWLVDVAPDETLVECEINLSSMIAGPQTPQIDQWLVRCQPRDEFVMPSLQPVSCPAENVASTLFCLSLIGPSVLPL